MKTWCRSALVAGNAIAASLAWPYGAEACSCLTYPNLTAEQVRYGIEAGLDHSAAVFSGEVVSADLQVALIRVQKVWKGEIGSEIRMRQATLMPNGTLLTNTCDFTFHGGKKYLVFGTRVSPDLMNAEHCGLTQLLDTAGETISLLETILAIRNGQQPDSYARFLALERSWMKALESRDTTALEALLAPEFTSIGTGAAPQAPVTDRAGLLRNAASFPLPSHEVRLVKVHDRGDLAIVSCLLTATYPPKSVTPEGGKLHFLVTDVWIRRGTTWQILSQHASLAD